MRIMMGKLLFPSIDDIPLSGLLTLKTDTTKNKIEGQSLQAKLRKCINMRAS